VSGGQKEGAPPFENCGEMKGLSASRGLNSPQKKKGRTGAAPIAQLNKRKKATKSRLPRKGVDICAEKGHRLGRAEDPTCSTDDGTGASTPCAGYVKGRTVRPLAGGKREKLADLRSCLKQVSCNCEAFAPQNLGGQKGAVPSKGPPVGKGCFPQGGKTDLRGSHEAS